MQRTIGLHTILVAVLLSSFLGCGDARSPERPVLRLVVTTSTRDSGLLEVLIPAFQQQRDVQTDVIAVGSGKALKLGEAGDADVLLVHAKEAEDAFLAAGYGVRREGVMYNTFQLIGPADDPAAVRGSDPVSALKKIGAGQFLFVSRGDRSGTHQRELRLWEQAGGRPEWADYLETGQGMGPTLIVADQVQAYTLTDLGTYLRFRSQIELEPLVDSSPMLHNPYGAIVVNPEKHAGLQAVEAHAFVDFLISAQGQRLISEYKIDGQQLFFPQTNSQSD